MKKLISIFLITLLLLSILPQIILADDTRASVVVSPNNAGSVGSWYITIPADTLYVYGGGKIKGFTINFPDGSTIPENLSPGHISVNNMFAKAVLVDTETNTITFNLEKGIPTSMVCQICISDKAGIVNPKAAERTMSYSAWQGTNVLYSNTFVISEALPFTAPTQKETTATKTDTTTTTPTTDTKGSVVLTIGSTTAYIDGKAQSLDASPVIVNSSTMVPLRFITEALGAKIDYDATTKTVTIEKDDTTMKLWIGSVQAKVGTKVVTMTTAPSLINNRTMVPIRFISENLGAQVDFDSKTQTITIKTNSSTTETKTEVKATQTSVTTDTTTVVGKTANCTTNVNMRKDPSTTSEKMGLMLAGETATITDTKTNTEGTWYKLKFSETLSAWVNAKYLTVK